MPTSDVTDRLSGRRLALVIGTSTYADPSLRQLRAPAQDAVDLEAVLADPQIGAFSVTAVVDGTGQQVRLAVGDFLADRQPNDLLLIYLSCHGLVDLRRRLYFAASDTRKDRLAATGVEAEWLLDQLDDCRARRQVVILDCCFSGAFAQRGKGDGDLGLGERFSGQDRGRVVLTASRASEYSFEGEPVPGTAIPSSVFTSALVAGLRTGEADLDRDGYVSVDDAYGYIFDQVRSGDAQQTPQRWLYGAEGSITLARNTNPDAVRPRQPAAAPGTPVAASPAGANSLVRQVVATWPGRLLLTAGASALAAVVALLVLRGQDDSSAWRLVAKNPGVNGVNPACTVTVTNRRTHEQRIISDVYGQETYIMQHSGQYTWSQDVPGCTATAVAGPGTVRPPLLAAGTTGDSPSFIAHGRINVKVEQTNQSECHLALYGTESGQALDEKTATAVDTTITLDPQGVSPVYIAEVYCNVRIFDAQ